MPFNKDSKEHAKYIEEVERAIKSIAKNIAPLTGQQKQAYYGTENKVLGLTVPQQRQLLKVGYSFSHLSMNEQLAVWNSIWYGCKHHESKAQALFWLSNIKDINILVEFWPTIKDWITAVDSWDASDNLSSVYVRILEDAENIIYPTLQAWNKSKNSWERRQSLVSLLYYSSARKKVLPHKKIFSLIENLLGDPDKFVQKGVGWTLRECYSVYPEITEKFVRQRATILSATAFSAASEKWPSDLLLELKTTRAERRKDGRSSRTVKIITKRSRLRR